MTLSRSRRLVSAAALAAVLAAPALARAQEAPAQRPPARTPRATVAQSAPAPADQGATTPAAGVANPAAASLPDPARADPWEPTNRKLYNFSTAVDRRFIRPGVVFYHHATPTPVRHSVSNALSNLSEPIIFINDVLQLRPKNAGKSLARFVVNSTVGIGGLFDVATKAGVPFHPADFGETLGRYGVPSGPYIYIPILGPSTVRALVGRGVDSVADPFNAVNYGQARDVLVPVRTVVGATDARDQVDSLLKDIDRTATDPYATIRSLYLQNRRALVQGGATSASEVQALPSFGPEPSATGVRHMPPPVSAPAPAPPAGAPSD